MNARLSELFATRIDTVSDLEQLEFQSGQVWTVQSGRYDGLQILVVKTERHPTMGVAVHVSVRGPLTTEGGSELEGIPHLPFTPEAMRHSGLQLTGFISELPDDWQDMYEDWLSDAEMEEAGLFSLPLREILDTIMAKLSWI